MKSKPPVVTLLRPGPKSWESWVQTEPAQWVPAPNGEAAKKVSTLAIPAKSLCSVPLTVTSSDPAVIEGMVRVQLQSRGLTLPNKGAISYQTLVEHPDRSQILATTLLDQDLDVPATADSYEVSAALLLPPKDGILIWRELGQLVVLFTRDLSVAHFQVLSQTELDQEACLEILALQQSLQVRDLIDEPTVIEVRDLHLSKEREETLLRTLSLPLQSESTESLRDPAERSRLMPARIAQQRESRKLRQKLLWGGAIALALYLLFMGGWGIRLALLKGEIANMQDELQGVDGLAGQVREARIQVAQVEPAIDYETFPLEKFHRLVELLPDQGIRLTYFEITPGKIIIRGEANNSNAAVSFKAQLRGNEVFREYEWDFPQPQLLPNDQARFDATGTLPDYTP